jgi:hypothetical protein
LKEDMNLKVIGSAAVIGAVVASSMALVKLNQPIQGTKLLEVKGSFLGSGTAPYDYDFYQFMAQFGKSYQTIAQMEQRYQIY